MSSYQLSLNAAVTWRRPTAIPATLNNIVVELESLPGFTFQLPFIALALTLQKLRDKSEENHQMHPRDVLMLDVSGVTQDKQGIMGSELRCF